MLIIFFACREQFFEHERTPIQPGALDTVLRNGDGIQSAFTFGIILHRLASNEIASEPNLRLVNQINFGAFPPSASAIFGIEVRITHLLCALRRCLTGSGDIYAIQAQPCEAMNVFSMDGDLLV